ncbi:MAG: hypothetical protein A2667_00300 [Candidatus Wildermuthbacteria bacterium RIFCSPHIGHO2_01_FULL_47_27]|uniref:Uncharacterized protein n=1 Tax=Candidatus Wildermuthbacteria bacterium RIFCSPLOWO2_01_FULL_48_35 TaxID=1802463 RepID=A0A1G2RSL3_9BACT|nr:MAG: hypothetical protein A2667_00300 [Candidatus Wildermuthbacteria bacterium RIFCSPHIGHO2_01_FULL_47_27]OHA75844.1 MAG: hypothetical protein A3A32_01730 [Candidatus Wildermuthbacteria bacterium RIFCSPLOWO2_01_FULL_48_35]OHA76399.1 MAG: hypothetical protein A3I38_01475 [Candidatus Wildermuthbacteria bacterium RIFCSPLOWO2_02_FULL_47_10]
MAIIPFPELWRGWWLGGIIGGASRVALEFILCALAAKYLHNRRNSLPALKSEKYFENKNNLVAGVLDFSGHWKPDGFA